MNSIIAQFQFQMMEQQHNISTAQSTSATDVGRIYSTSSALTTGTSYSYTTAGGILPQPLSSSRYDPGIGLIQKL